MEFRILGPLHADAGTGGGPAVIRQPLLQSALALLLLRANRPCPRGLLIEALWGSEPPRSPEVALRVCMSRLRRSLGDCAIRIDSIGPPGGRAPGHRQQRGYMITVRPGELDVEEFTDLVAQGQAELDSGNAAAAATSLVHALALWGDPPLPDLPDSDVITADIEKLTNMREAAIGALIEARLAAGEAEQVLGQLRAMVSANPGRERACEQLMRTYQALGMRTEALDVYRAARAAIREQQGAEPGQALAMLQQRILAEEMASDGAAHLNAISLATPMLLGWQAPAPPSDFTGRQAELAAIIDSLVGPSVPVTVICGGPGAGKTSTAATAALLMRDRFSEGQLYVELGGVERPRDPQDVLGEMLRAMGIPARSIPSTGPTRAALYRSLLAGRKVLVIADDVAAAAQVRPLLPAAGGAAVLVTSRARLSGLAGAKMVELSALPEEDSLALLEAAAGADRVKAEPAAARQVINACGGLPLAVRLAAVSLAARPGLSLAGLAGELTGGQALDVLAAEDTSVAESIGSSYRALSSSAGPALCTAAAIVPGDLPGWALDEVTEGDRKVAEQLAAVGLLMPIQSDVTGERYHVHPLTRAYALARQPAAPKASALHRLLTGWLWRSERAAEHLPAVPFVPTTRSAAESERSEPAVDDGELGSDWLDREQANLVAAAEQASSVGCHREAMLLASCLTARLCVTGRYADAISLWRAVAGRAQGAGEVNAATASYYLAAVLVHSNDGAPTAAGLLARSLPVLEQASDWETAALGWCLLGKQASIDRRHAAAIRLARHAIELSAGRSCAALVRSSALTVLGLTLARIGACDAGVQHCLRACSDARNMHEPVYEAHATKALAQVMILSGAYDQAAALCLAGISLARGYGSTVDVARFELVLGRTRQCCVEPEAAIPSLRTAADSFRDAGLVLDEVTARSMLATSFRSAGDETAAADQTELVSQLLTHIGQTDTKRRAAEVQHACELRDHERWPGHRRPISAG